jgi:hypothetical protein
VAQGTCRSAGVGALPLIQTGLSGSFYIAVPPTEIFTAATNLRMPTALSLSGSAMVSQAMVTRLF